MDQCDDVRPSHCQFPVACRLDGLAVNFWIVTFQRLQYLSLKTLYPTHRKNGRQHPLPVATGVRGLDRVRMPVLGSAHRCLQNSAAYFFGKTLVEIKLLERVPDVAKSALSDARIVRIIEPIRLRLFEDRPKGNRSAGAQPF